MHNNSVPPSYDQILSHQITPQQQQREDALFIAEHAPKTKLFHIQSFNTNLMNNNYGNNGGVDNKYNSSLFRSKEMLIDQQCEKSPMFFKISGTVSYCPQLDGCCIFYNRGISVTLMNILYSKQCQEEIFDRACKLYENSIPNHVYLFQLGYSSILMNKFKLLGLSTDTIILKVKHEAPSKRNTFMYNAAQLQLQMLKFDFIITPNLTHYYVKQYLNYPQSDLITTPSNQLTPPPPSLPPQQHQQDEEQHIQESQQNNTLIEEQIVNTECSRQEIKVINAPTLSLPPLEDYDNEYSSESGDERESTDEEDVEVNFSEQPLIVVENINDTSKTTKPQQILKTFINDRNKPISIASSETASSRDYIGATAAASSTSSKLSSVGIIPARVTTSSETGITERFHELHCTVPPDSSECMDICTVENDSPRRTIYQFDVESLNDMLIQKHEQTLSKMLSDRQIRQNTKFNSPKTLYLTNDENKRYYNPNFLQTLQFGNDIEFIQNIFNNLADATEGLEKYVEVQGYVRGKEQSVSLALHEVKLDESDRFKQAVYLYLLSPAIKLTCPLN